MPNPMPAFRNVICDDCGEPIPEGEDVFFVDGSRFCGDCASANGNICECGNYKKAEYETCYECR